jgi:putative transposase
MTYLPANVMGRWFHLYLILDLYSRKIVGAEVHDSDDADHAAHLVRRTALAEGIASMHTKPVLHGDNGSTLKATTVLAMLHWLGVQALVLAAPRQRRQRLRRVAVPHGQVPPRVPAKGFASLDEARAWAADSCTGTTSSTATAASATSALSSAMPARTRPSWLRGTRSTSGPRTQPGTLVGRHPQLVAIGAVTLNPERDAVVTWLPQTLTILSRWLREIRRQLP